MDGFDRTRTRVDADAGMILRDAFADRQQGSGDLTIPELIIEHDPVTDRVRSVNEPPPGTIFRRV